MNYLFGIDGGGTSSRIRVETLDGELLYYGEGGSTNPRSNDREAIEAVLTGLFGEARAAAGLSGSGCRAGFAGIAGVDRPGDREPFIEMLRRTGGVDCPIAVGNDAEPALAGALDDTEGILLIAGTGSIALGRSRDGFSARAGGLGHLLGDEGSAWRIAFDAICRGLRSAEGRDLESGLLEAALTFEGLTVEMISDNRHLPPTLMKLAFKSLGPDRLCAVSDACSGAGLAEGARYSLGALTFEVEGGVGQSLDRKVFGGSTTLLSQMIPVLTSVVGIPLALALRMVSLTPARVIGADAGKGSIEVGKDADLAIFSDDFSAWRTMIRGLWI